jgi:hypothetical protein
MEMNNIENALWTLNIAMALGIALYGSLILIKYIAPLL